MFLGCFHIYSIIKFCLLLGAMAQISLHYPYDMFMLSSLYCAKREGTVDPWDMASNFCLIVWAQSISELIMVQNGDDFASSRSVIELVLTILKH